MYETIAVIVVAGLWATTSLLFRHWDAIESYESKQQQQQLQVGNTHTGRRAAAGYRYDVCAWRETLHILGGTSGVLLA